MSSPIAIRSLQDVQIRALVLAEDFQKAEQVQVDTWGFCALDVVPAAIFSVAHHFGGQALGAFDSGCMIGFALSFGAVEQGHAHFHSHMVAVLPEFQNLGLGRMIKLAQREDAVRRGIDQIVWTFDPLQTRNAYFNIARLGGIGVRYLHNLYGTTSSPLHGGMPTDRLVIEWNLTSPHVLSALAGQPRTRPAEAKCVTIPSASNDLPLAERVANQQRLRQTLVKLMDDGYVVTGLERDRNAAQYILERQSSFQEKP